MPFLVAGRVALEIDRWKLIAFVRGASRAVEMSPRLPFGRLENEKKFNVPTVGVDRVSQGEILQGVSLKHFHIRRNSLIKSWMFNW